jgi:alkane 1-monooxygenase
MKAEIKSWGTVGGSYFSFLLFGLFDLAVVRRGGWFLLPATLVMIVVPILDLVSSRALAPQKHTFSWMQERLVEVAPALFVVGNAAVIGISAHILSRMTMAEKLCAALSVGMIGGVGISAAHELIHKSNRLSKIFGRVGLANVFYLHFEIHHIRGHHVRVGTKEDQSTAWLGESLYQFILRTVPGCFKSSLRLEQEKLTRRGVAHVSFENLMFQFAFLQVVYLIGVWYLGDWPAVVFFVCQAVVAVFMLESTSYIEHYGLLRGTDPDGKYEPMSPANSWDCYGRFSSYLVFQLQRHADHHRHPARPFFSLETVDDSPKLPVGYPLLIGIALVPPLWRKIMDPRVNVTSFDCRRGHTLRGSAAL